MNDMPYVVCPKCGSSARKIPSLCSISVKNSHQTWKVFDGLRQENDIKHDLKDRYGIESVRPLAGQTLREVYDDIRSRGSEARDMMQAKMEQSAKAKKAKQREWAIKASRRATQRRIEMQRRKAAEDSANRRIVL